MLLFTQKLILLYKIVDATNGTHFLSFSLASNNVIITSLSVTQFISSEVSMCPQLLIPLHRSVLEMQICDFAQRNSWQLEVSLNSVQMALKPLAPTALSAKKNLQKRKNKVCWSSSQTKLSLEIKQAKPPEKLGPKTKLVSRNFFDLLEEKQEN